MDRKKLSTFGRVGLNPVMIGVVNEPTLAGRAKSNDTLLVALAQDLDVPVLKVNILVLEGDDLGEAQARIPASGNRWPMFLAPNTVFGVHAVENPADLLPWVSGSMTFSITLGGFRSCSRCSSV